MLLVNCVIFMQRSLEISPSGIDPYKLWRHWGAGWVSFILVIWVLLREGLIYYLVRPQVSTWGLPVPVEGLERDKASNPQPKRGL
jgi:hypothetical protein